MEVRSTVLLVGGPVTEIERLRNLIRRAGMSSVALASDSDIVEAVRKSKVGVAIVLHGDRSVDAARVCSQLRTERLEQPLQLVVIGKRASEIEESFEHGIDDFLLGPVEDAEFVVRIRAAEMRFRSQKRVYEERAFFRRAARQEEELSSRVLDQHLSLKRAFESIESINRELEATNRRLERIAKYDILSGLLNRVSLFAVMDMEIERVRRSRTPLAGIMFDIDKFKDLNDNHGHLFGDDVIGQIGKCLKASLRRYDQAGRYGGEEFFVVLPNTNLHQAHIIAERFREQLAERQLENEGAPVCVTASFGVAEYLRGETRDSWIGRVDRNMYIAKQAGRNRVVAG